jgi:hypothetical protein
MKAINLAMTIKTVFKLIPALPIVFLIACNKSPLSEQDVNELGLIHARIELVDQPDNDIIDSLSVHLSDGDKPIGNEGLKVFVNGQALPLWVNSDGYYGIRASYALDSIPLSEHYRFELQTSDGNLHSLGSIKALPSPSKSLFALPESIPHNQNFVLRWPALEHDHQIRIWKNTKLKNSNTLSGGPYAESTIHTSSTLSAGKLTIPQSFFEDSESIATAVNIEFLSSYSGEINTELMDGSSITLSHELAFKQPVSRSD